MFLRLLWESFVRQRRRKALAAIAILLGTTAVTAMLALATTIGDRIHRELAVYGANIVITPRAATLAVNIGGVDLKPATGNALLKTADLDKLRTIFWANNITGVSPELTVPVRIGLRAPAVDAQATGYWFDHDLAGLTTGAPQLHPWWKLAGTWPTEAAVVLGQSLARQLGARVGDRITLTGNARPLPVTGIVTTGDSTDMQVLLPLADAQRLQHNADGFDRADISARTKPEDAFARQDPDHMSPAKREIWYCRPYANSIAYQIREAIPGAAATQVRRVEQSEGTVLSRISGLMWLVSAAALLAAGFAVSAAMATAVMERRIEIGLMRSLGASRGAIALLFYAESGLLAVAAGSVGFAAGSGLAWSLGARIFPHDPAGQVFNPVLLPVVVAMALAVAVLGATPSIRAALSTDPAQVLRGHL